MEAVSEARASSSNWVRGWWLADAADRHLEEARTVTADLVRDEGTETLTQSAAARHR